MCENVFWLSAVVFVLCNDVLPGLKLQISSKEKNTAGGKKHVVTRCRSQVCRILCSGVTVMDPTHNFSKPKLQFFKRGAAFKRGHSNFQKGCVNHMHCENGTITLKLWSVSRKSCVVKQPLIHSYLIHNYYSNMNSNNM